MGAEGTAGAAWCPWRAEAALRPPMLAALAESLRPNAVATLAAWRRARRFRGDGRLTLNPREDVFAPGADAAHRSALVSVLESLLRDGTPVALTTRGDTTTGGPLLDLARRFGDRLWVRIGVFGGDMADEARWEPGLPRRGARLDLAASLAAAGAHVEVELGPILPFVNDDVRHWRSLVRAIARTGVTRIVPRVIAGTPALVRQIERELNPGSARLVQGWLARGTDDPWLTTRRPERRGTERPAPTGSMARALPEHAREHRLKRLEEAVANTPVKVATCACFDAGQAHVCHVAGPAITRLVQQLPLFTPELLASRK